MTMTRDQFVDFFASKQPYLEEIFEDDYKLWSTRRIARRIFDVVPAPLMYYDKTGRTGLGLMSEKGEGENAAQDRLYQGFDVRLSCKVYELQVPTSWEVALTDPEDALSSLAPEFAKSGADSVDYYAASIINNGFTATAADWMSKLPDGLALFSRSHLTAGPDSDVFHTRQSTHEDLSNSALQNALNTFRAQVNHRGMLINIEPKVLLVPPALEWLAVQIMRNPAEHGTAERNINPITNVVDLEIIMWPGITDPDSFYIFGTPSDTGLRMAVGEDLWLAHDVDFDSTGFKSKAHMNMAWGWVHAWAVWGSTGSG